ncbi:MAG: MFS transporter [Bacteroidales bacterium]
MSSIFKKFSQAFWVANTVEMFERMAYYTVFIVITLYLSKVMGFSDLEAGLISGVFSGALYLLPTFTGAYADKIGFRKSMLVAFTLLTIGYLGLGVLPTLLESAGLVSYGMDTTFTGLRESSMRWAIVPVMVIIVIGGAFIKSIISGTVAKETTPETRAKGFSLFYMMVNIGSFTGKTVVEPIRKAMGNEGLVYLNYFSASATFLALIAVYFLYKTTHNSGEGKSFREIGKGLLGVLTNSRLIILTLIVSGFWMVYYQLYATMPKYVIRMAGEDSTPAWYANVNPLVVVLLVNAVTNMMKKRSAITSMAVGMLLMPLSALLMASGNMMGESIFGLNPIAFMMVIGIAVQALAETFISPRYLEYFSMQAPKGDEGMYLGFSHINSFIASILGFGLSGYLLGKYCPDPSLFPTHEAWQAASVHAHYIWFYFAAIGLVSAIALFIFGAFSKEKK